VRLSIADSRNLSRRDLWFVLFLAGSLTVSWKPLRTLFSFALTHDYASHVILIIPVSAYLIYLKRGEIFFAEKTGPLPGSVLFLTGTILWWFAEDRAVATFRDSELSLLILGIVIIWISGFVFCYGAHAFARGRFPLLISLIAGTNSSNCNLKDHLFSSSWVFGGGLRAAAALLGSSAQAGVHLTAPYARHRSGKAM
jgi:hypothetical protein